MAFSGYLIKLKGTTDEVLPLDFIAVDSYSATPDQRMEAKANRATSGKLDRQTVSHTATKIEFETPPITNHEVAVLNTLIHNHYTNALKRDVSLEYYDNDTDTYKTGNFYMPDIQYKISRIDIDTNTIYYDKIRYAFIEY